MSSRCRSWLHALGVVLVTAALAGCQRELPGATPDAPRAGQRAEGVRQVDLRPGIPPAEPVHPDPPYRRDAHTIAEGKRLYGWMNCSGCHFEGGGGIGPPLMDQDWIYGSRPHQIFDSIVNGRAQGMPAYGDKLEVQSVWQIVAYVESLGGVEGREGDQAPGQQGGRQ